MIRLWWAFFSGLLLQTILLSCCDSNIRRKNSEEVSVCAPEQTYYFNTKNKTDINLPQFSEEVLNDESTLLELTGVELEDDVSKQIVRKGVFLGALEAVLCNNEEIINDILSRNHVFVAGTMTVSSSFKTFLTFTKSEKKVFQSYIRNKDDNAWIKFSRDDTYYGRSIILVTVIDNRFIDAREVAHVCPEGQYTQWDSGPKLCERISPDSFRMYWVNRSDTISDIEPFDDYEDSIIYTIDDNGLFHQK